MAMKFETVPADQVETAPRGRSTEIDEDLVEAFKNIKTGEALNLAPKFGAVDQEDRPSVGQTIRKNWAYARSDKCRIDFGVKGIPHVQIKVEKHSKRQPAQA